MDPSPAPVEPSPEDPAAEDVPGAPQSWVRTALLRAVVAGVLGAVAYGIHAWALSSEGHTWKQSLNLAGLLAGLPVFALALCEHLGWGRTKEPGAWRLLGVSALAGVATSAICLAIQHQASYSVTLWHQGYAKAWGEVQLLLLYAWDFPVAPAAALMCFGVAGASCCLARGSGLGFLERCAVTVLATLPLCAWLVAGTSAIPYGKRSLLFVLLSIAALVFPCSGALGDLLQRLRWKVSTSRPARRRALAWGAVLGVLLAGPLVERAFEAWQAHQDDEIERLYALRSAAETARREGNHSVLLELCATARDVGLRGVEIRAFFDEHEPLARWIHERAGAPPHPDFSKDAGLLVERGEFRYESRGDLQAALADCDAALSLPPNGETRGAYVLRAWVRRSFDPAGAVADYRAAFQTQTMFVLGPDAYRLRAVFFRELGDYEAASADCEAGLRQARRYSFKNEWTQEEWYLLQLLRIDLARRQEDPQQATQWLDVVRRELAFRSGHSSWTRRRLTPPPGLPPLPRPPDRNRTAFESFLIDLKWLEEAPCPQPLTATRSGVVERLIRPRSPAPEHAGGR